MEQPLPSARLPQRVEGSGWCMAPSRATLKRGPARREKQLLPVFFLQAPRGTRAIYIYAQSIYRRHLCIGAIYV